MQSLPSPLLSGPSYNRCQVRGVAYRPRAYNGPGDPSGIVLFGFPIEQVGYLFLRPAIHNLVCRHFVSRIHAHVQRPRLAKRKAPRGLIKLHARNSQVGQDPVHPGNPQLVHDLRNPRERRLHQRRPLPKGLQPFPGQLQRLCVPVQADQSPGKAPWSRPRDQLLRDGRRVPAGSQRCVHVRSVRLYAQPFEHLIQHHRRVRLCSLRPPLASRLPRILLWGHSPLPRLDPQIFQRLVVVACVRLVLQAIDHARMVHHLEIIQVPEHIHFALHLRRFAQHRGN